jgi:hypothetical protein
MTTGEAVMPVRLVERVLVPAGFAAAAASFVLPFAARRLTDPMIVSAQTWSGWALTIGGASQPHLEIANYDSGTGTYVLEDLSNSIPVEFGTSSGTFASAQPGFVVAAILVIAGLATAILSGTRTRTLVAAIAAFAAVIALGLAEGGFLRGLGAADPVQGASVLADAGEPTTGYGYWVAIGLLTALGVIAALLYLRSRQEAAVPPEVPAGPASGSVIEIAT